VVDYRRAAGQRDVASLRGVGRLPQRGLDPVADEMKGGAVSRPVFRGDRVDWFPTFIDQAASGT
jgi:hypothetical protein